MRKKEGESPDHGRKKAILRHHGPDYRAAALAYFGVCAAAGAGHGVPAAVQLCRYGHRGPLPGHRRTGCCGQHLLAELFDFGLHPGRVCRLRHPCGRGLRREKPGRSAPLPGQRRVALRGGQRGVYDFNYPAGRAAAAAHPHAGRYFCGRRQVRPGHLFGHPGHGAVQLLGQRAAVAGRFQASVLLFAGGQHYKHRAGLGAHRAGGHGRGRRGTGHRRQPAVQRPALHLVVLRQGGGHPFYQREHPPLPCPLQAAGGHRPAHGV